MLGYRPYSKIIWSCLFGRLRTRIKVTMSLIRLVSRPLPKYILAEFMNMRVFQEHDKFSLLPTSIYDTKEKVCLRVDVCCKDRY